MNLLAIDTGPETCGVVLLDVDEFPPRVIYHKADMQIVFLLDTIRGPKGIREFEHVAAERFASQRKPLGNESIYTIEVYGRIWQQCLASGVPFSGIYRREVKQELGMMATANDAQVNEALRYTYPATGGGKTPQKGTKKQPGPLYGLKDHAWPALGVGVAWCLRRIRKQRAKELEALKAEEASQPELFE
jgi:hypothetical protein